MNGENAVPVYKFLKSGKWGFFKDDIQWNFSKFLVDKSGKVVDRYYPTTSPLTIEVKPICQFYTSSHTVSLLSMDSILSLIHLPL